MSFFKTHKIKIVNSLFLILCGGILLFLYNAPKETTAFLPHDSDHKRFFAIKSKKEAEKSCVTCHDVMKMAPLPQNHPPKYRCLFCHKRK